MSLPESMSPGHCLDCKAPVLSGPFNGEYTIIHSGTGCEGFRRRFGEPGTTAARTESGEVISKGPAALPAKTSAKKEDK